MSYIPAKTSSFVAIESLEDLLSRNINDYFSAVDRDLQNLFLFSNFSYMFGSGEENEILQYDPDVGTVTFVPSLGGWTIGGDLLWSGASATYIGLEPGTGIWLGDEAFTDAPFSVDPAGVLKAHSGTVGDWNLTSTKLWKGTDLDEDYIALDPDIGIHMGAEAFADAYFSVTKEGALKAVSGTIGGWTIGATKLTAGSGPNNIALDTADGIYMGSDSPGSAPFAVDRYGSLRATITKLTAPIIQTNNSPGTDRVVIDSSGIRGYDDVLGTTFILPTDGSAPIFANGTIQSATIIETTIISNDFKTSSELPWVEMTDNGLAYRENTQGAVYGTGLYGTATYGSGVAGYVGKSDLPFVSIDQERALADIHLYNRTSDPTGAARVGDLMVKSAVPYMCTTAGTPGTYTKMVLDGATVASLVLTTADINAGTFDGIVGGTTPAAGTFTTLIGTNVDGIIGANTPAAGAFTTLSASGLITATGGQIKFPATAVPSADANTLDDYEEGTWTPTINFGGAAVDVTYNATYTKGSYTKIGNLVTVTGTLLLTSKGSSNGNAFIAGLPFTSVNDDAVPATVSIRIDKISFADMMNCQIPKNSASITMQEASNAGTLTNIDDANFANDSTCIVTVSYRAA